MPLELGPGGWAAVTGLAIAGITFAVEKLVTPLGNFGKLAYAVAVILVIYWAVLLLSTLIA